MPARASRGDVHKSAFTPSMTSTQRPSFSASAGGFLEKKSTGLMALWQRRYFVASGRYLRYYADEDCTTLLAKKRRPQRRPAEAEDDSHVRVLRGATVMDRRQAAVVLWGSRVEQPGGRTLVLVTSDGVATALRAPDKQVPF
ncbi:hypothetical protein M885DRAFT_211690 [Pelagophyceae sp. CCMP2097]|nr:hypothetical protein M885DRAFT_211690 [Pelagophyceae sp. CCMP2097]